MISTLLFTIASFLGSIETLSDYASEGYLRWLLNHPGLMLFIILGFYLVWLPFAALSWIVQALVTGWVAFLILIALLFITGRVIASAIIFPISVSMVAKSMQKEVASKVRSKIDRCLSSLEKHCINVSASDVIFTQENVQSNVSVVSAIETLRQPLLNVWINQQQIHETCNMHEEQFAHSSILRHYIQSAISLIESLQGVKSTTVMNSSNLNDNSLQILAMYDPASLPLSPDPPFISLGSTTAALSSLDSSGFSKLEMCQLALACLSRARWLSIWIEVIPYSTGLGGESAAREIASSLKMSKPVLHQAISSLWKSYKETIIHRLTLAIICRRQTRFANTRDYCKDADVLTGPLQEFAKRLGIPASVLEEVKCQLTREVKMQKDDASAINVTSVTANNENADNVYGKVSEACGKNHESCEQDDDEESKHMHVRDPSESTSPPPSLRWDFIKHVSKQARKVIMSILDAIWKFFTSKFIPEPACGLSYFRGEAELVNGRQLWLPTDEDGMWVDAMYFKSLVPSGDQVKAKRIRSNRFISRKERSDSIHANSDSSLPEWVSDCYSNGNGGLGRRRRGGRGASNADEISVIESDGSINDDVPKETGINIAPLRIPLIHTTSIGRVSLPGVSFRSVCISLRFLLSPILKFFYSTKALQPPDLTEAKIASQIAFAAELGGSGSAASTVSSRGVVLICGPNAGLYEYSWRFSEWVDKYRRLGFDVVVYNYRGYGRSCRRVEVKLFWGIFKYVSKDDSPRPVCLQRDAQAVASWILRETRSNTSLIVHGESLGGIAACHLGKLGLCDFLIADRTFDTLTSAGRHMVGAWSEPALIALTGWTGSNATNFVKFMYQSLDINLDTPTNTTTTTTEATPITSSGAVLPSISSSPLVFKIVAQDFDDQVIHHEASLALGVAAVISTHSSDRTRIKGELNVCAAQLYLLLIRSMRESAHLFTVKENIKSDFSISPLLRLRIREASKVMNVQTFSEIVVGETGNAHLSPSLSTYSDSSFPDHLRRTLTKRGLQTPVDSLSFQESILLLYGARPKSEFTSAALSSHEASSLCALAERKVEQAHGDRLLGDNQAVFNTNGAFANALLEASARISKKCIEYDTEMFNQGCERLRLPGTVSIVIAGLSNGLGLRLGDVVSSASVGERGVASVRAFIASAIMWGWPLQERKGLLYDLRSRAASRISSRINSSRGGGGNGGGGGVGGNGGVESVGVQESLMNPNSLAWVFGSKTMPYLHSSSECSLSTAKRRLESMLCVLQADRIVPRAIGEERLESDNDSFRENSSKGIIQETLNVLERIEKLRVELEEIVTDKEKQVCLPLAVGHNSPWSDADLAILETFLEEV